MKKTLTTIERMLLEQYHEAGFMRNNIQPGPYQQDGIAATLVRLEEMQDKLMEVIKLVRGVS